MQTTIHNDYKHLRLTSVVAREIYSGITWQASMKLIALATTVVALLTAGKTKTAFVVTA